MRVEFISGSSSSATTISLTTAGTSGASTLSGAGVLNIPIYADENTNIGNTNLVSSATTRTYGIANGGTLTFKAIGSAAIKTATGLQVEFVQYPTITPTLLTKTIRAGSSGTTINLNGTYGVGVVGDGAIVTGVGITYATISGVTASSSAGSIVVSASQGTLTTGTPVYVTNVVQTFNVHGTIKLLNHPSANKNIYLDVDRFLTPGTSS